MAKECKINSLTAINLMVKALKVKTYKFLRWTEKWIKTDMVYFTKGGFWLTTGQIFSALSAFLLSIAFANLLPLETYGNYKYVLSLAGILSIPTLAGMNTALAQAVASGSNGSFIPAVRARIKWGLLGALASFLLAGYYFYQDNSILTISFLIAAIFLPFMDSFNSYEAVLIGKKLFQTNTKYSIILKLLATIITIMVLFLTDNIFIIIFSYFIIYTFLRFLFLQITIQRIKLNDKIDLATISYGKHLSLMGIIEIIVSQLDKILVFNYLGAIELGIYSFAIAMPEQIKGLLKNIQALALPKFAQSINKETRKTILIKMLKLALFTLPITVIYIISAPYIFKIFFPQYLNSVFYSQLFSISLVTISTSLPLAYLQAHQAQKQLYQLNAISPIIQMIILFISIYFFGLIGIISARILNRFINLFIVVLLLEKNK